MPGEEMEITTDFGHSGFGEDIDIDLDFAVGQPDEDLELADFDQVQEMQNFNTDSRDELMAEGDDASYGMIDADDVEHNEVATATNDIEIDLGDPENNLWDQNNLQDTFNNADEIDYVENNDINNVNTENDGNGEDSWAEAANYSVSQSFEEEPTQVDVGPTDITGNALPKDMPAQTDGVDSQDFGVSETRKEDAEAASIGGAAANELENAIGGVFDGQQDAELDGSLQQATEEFAAGEQTQLERSDDQLNDSVSHGNTDEAHEDLQRLASHNEDNEVSEIGYDDGDDGDNALTHDDGALTSATSDQEPVGEQNVEPEEQPDKNDGPDPEISEQQLGVDLYAEPTNDQELADEGTTQEEALAPDATETQEQSSTHDSENENDKAANASEDDQGKPRVEHVLSIATRYEMFIRYGRTNYKLFAKSEDDDPNEYFLRDMSAMELPLNQFLSSLRDVIADELSPLDELVLHIDGLGIQFSESTTNEMIGSCTFGDILTLYDRLVKNDGDSSPDLCIYLMVRPDCHQRLNALYDMAETGRGLSEVAVYRDMTPFDDEQVSAVSPHSEDEEEGYEYEENEYEETNLIGDGTDENGNDGEAEDDVDPSSPSVHAPAAEANTEDSTGHTEKTGSIVNGNDGENADDLIDYSDNDEPDPSSLQQDQANVSSRDSEHEASNEPEVTVTAESSDPNQHTPPANGSVDAPNSDATSATATLVGDDKDEDEIDYTDDDEPETTGGNDGLSNDGVGAPATLQVPVEDEITWESENEDVQNDPVTAPKETVQVSPSTKRPRSNSDSDLTQQNDIKRRRPS